MRSYTLDNYQRDAINNEDRIVLLKDALQKDGSLQSTYYIPWFLKCNPNRYPSWFYPFQGDPRIV